MEEPQKVERSRLMEITYFRVMLEEDEKLDTITLPEKSFINEIWDIINKNDVSLSKKENPVLSGLKYIFAAEYLGINRNNDELNLLRLLTREINLTSITQNFTEFVQLNLIRNVAKLFELKLTHYADSHIDRATRQIIFYDLNTQTLSKLIPYMDIFSRAFVICDIYDLDYNLITAQPTIKDMAALSVL